METQPNQLHHRHPQTEIDPEVLKQLPEIYSDPNVYAQQPANQHYTQRPIGYDRNDQSSYIEMQEPYDNGKDKKLKMPQRTRLWWCRRKNVPKLYPEDFEGDIDPRKIDYFEATVYRLACMGISIAVMLIFYLVFWGDSQIDPIHNHIHSYIDLQWVTQNDEGVNFERSSKTFQCFELEQSHINSRRFTGSSEDDWWDLEDLEKSVEKLHRKTKDELLCSCGPMYNFTMRYLSFRDPVDPRRLIHAYNPSLNCDKRNLSAVTESQIDIIPDSSIDEKKIARSNSCRIEFHEKAKECKEKRKEQIDGQVAWCAQSCSDLLDGITIYTK